MPEVSNTSFLGSTLSEVDNPEADVMIDVDDVTMIFNIANEQLNSLKEYAIALARRELRFKEFRALDGISLQVRRGDVFGILGTNGSGKSTLMKIIAGVLEPSKGTCTVNGSIAPLIELGAGFDLELTARENIYLNGALLGYSKKFIDQHFDEIVDFAEVRQFLDMPLKNYSSGMVARIAFAIATVIVPDILIVDEVLSVGDFMFQQKCEQRIQELIKQHGVTVLLVSHSNDQIKRLCNKAAWIEKGHLRAIGKTEDVCQIYQAIGGRTGSIEAEKRILDAISTSRATPESLRRSVFGEDRYGTAVRLNEFCNAPSHTILLTNSDSEYANRIATGLAGALDAALLTVKADCVPEVTLQDIKHRNPECIVAIGSEGEISDTALQSISAALPDTKITRVEDDDNERGLAAYRYGKKIGAWGDAAVLVLPSANEAIMLALSPYIFSHKTPVFYINPDETATPKIESVLSCFETIIVAGSSYDLFSEKLRNLATGVRIVNFREVDYLEATKAVRGWIGDELSREGNAPQTTVVVTSPTSIIDNHLIGPFAGRINATILLENPQDLDSMADAIVYLEKKGESVDQMIFLGNEIRYNALGKSILANAAARKIGTS